MKVYMKVRQEFLVKVLDYKRAFTYLKIAILSAIPLFLLQVPLRVTPDDIIDRVRTAILPVKYRRYASAEKNTRMPIFYTCITLISILNLITVYGHSLRIPTFCIFARQILEDYLYRSALLIFIMVIFIYALLGLAYIIWTPFIYILIPRYYPDLEVYLESKRTHFNYFMKNLLTSPPSIIF